MGPYTFTQNYIQLYEDFVAEFPNSDYLAFLKTRMKTVYEFLEIPENNFTQKSFLPTNDYNSFNDLLSKFKDKVVFVDLWATWCGPTFLVVASRYDPSSTSPGAGDIRHSG